MPTSQKPRGRMNNAFNPEEMADLPEASRGLVERRAEVLGPAYRLFYERPIHIVRGSGCRLWDAEGNEYLDAYNNVVSVGHANPRVVGAVHDQMATLCTHTRYLHEGIVKYAEDLLGTFPGEPDDKHVMFTCTGSEANDLALRIAKYRTGNDGIIVTSEAYHGNSDQTAAFSPSLGENSPLGPWVRKVPAPDSYRFSPDELPLKFAGWVQDQIDELESHGNGVAALVVDSAFTSDGIFVEPGNLLAPAAEAVQRAGGLLVVDEVQCGFARMGENLWGYERQGVDPDIITMGKPMGNGFPVAGIAVKNEVVADFGHDMRYFNTFGGNPVAMAAAQATLEEIREERLLENAASVGAALRDSLIELQKRHSFIGDVRGSGLYLGIEIVKDPDSKTPDGATAVAIVNGLRDRRVLISATGPAGNVLKIRPPLVFRPADVDRLVTELDQELESNRI